MQRESLEMDESQALRGLLSVRKISSVFCSFPDLPNASSVGSLKHATPPICVRRCVVCIPNMSTFRAFPSLCVFLCICLHACTQQFTDHQHRLTCMFRKRLDQASFGLFCVAKHVQRACLILTQSTRVFHSLVNSSLFSGNTTHTATVIRCSRARELHPPGGGHNLCRCVLALSCVPLAEVASWHRVQYQHKNRM